MAAVAFDVVSDTQVLGMHPEHANTCMWCGAELSSDVVFQEYHMDSRHRIRC